MNFSDWWKQVQFHLGILDLDLALQDEKPTAIIDKSSDDKKLFCKEKVYLYMHFGTHLRCVTNLFFLVTNFLN